MAPDWTLWQRFSFRARRFLYRTCACRIDKWPVGLRVWWYNLTGRWAAFFSRQLPRR